MPWLWTGSFFSELLHFKPPKISPMKVEIPLFPLFRHPLPPRPPPLPSAPNTANKDIRCRGFFPPTSLCSVPLFLSRSLSILSFPASLYVHKSSRSIFTRLLYIWETIFAGEGGWQSCVHCYIFYSAPLENPFSHIIFSPHPLTNTEKWTKKSALHFRSN